MNWCENSQKFIHQFIKGCNDKTNSWKQNKADATADPDAFIQPSHPRVKGTNHNPLLCLLLHFQQHQESAGSSSVLSGHVFRENQKHRKRDTQMSFANQIELPQHYNNEITKASTPVIYKIQWKYFIILHLICKHVSFLLWITMKAQSC